MWWDCYVSFSKIIRNEITDEYFFNFPSEGLPLNWTSNHVQSRVFFRLFEQKEAWQSVFFFIPWKIISRYVAIRFLE